MINQINEITNVYGLAFFNLIKKDSDTLEFKNQIINLKKFFINNSLIYIFFKSYQFSYQQKVKYLVLFEKSFNKYLINFLKILIKNNLMFYLVSILDHIIALINNNSLIKIARVHTSYKLTDKQIKDIKNKLAKNYSCTIEIIEKLDDSLLGGIKIFIDNQIIDYSVNKQLQDIKDYLIKEFDE